MWQRIQTLHLIIAVALNLSIYWLGIAVVKLGGFSYHFSLYKLYNTNNQEVLYSAVILPVLCVATVVVCLLTIGLYKKRQVQIKLAKLALLVQAGFIAGIFLVIDHALSSIASTNSLEVTYNLGVYLAIFPLVSIFMAIKGIKKDEALVRAADRIR